MDTNLMILIATNVGGYIATVATLKNDINWIKVIINAFEQRIKQLETK